MCGPVWGAGVGGADVRTVCRMCGTELVAGVLGEGALSWLRRLCSETL